jgi:hypothetical protein
MQLEVGHPTTHLRCGTPAMSEKILDDGKIDAGIQQLGGHGVPQFMAGDA